MGLRVKKDNKESELLVMTVAKTENTGIRAASEQIQLAQVIRGALTIYTDVYDNTTQINGHFDRDTANNWLVELFEFLLGWLRDVNYRLELVDQYCNALADSKKISDGTFTLPLQQPLKLGTKATLRIRITRRVLFIPIFDVIIESVDIIVKGRLALDEAPEEIALQPTASPNSLTLEDSVKMKDMHLEITDTLANSNWHITASAPEPLVNENGNTLSNALYFSDGSQLHPLVP